MKNAAIEQLKRVVDRVIADHESQAERLDMGAHLNDLRTELHALVDDEPDVSYIDPADFDGIATDSAPVYTSDLINIWLAHRDECEDAISEIYGDAVGLAESARDLTSMVETAAAIYFEQELARIVCSVVESINEQLRA